MIVLELVIFCSTFVFVKLIQDGIDEGILLRTCSNNETYMEGFAIQLSQLNVEEPRPYNLHRCLSDVEDGIKRLVSIDDVESLKSNMVHVDDDFICNGTVTTARLEYEQASLDSVKVHIFTLFQNI